MRHSGVCAIRKGGICTDVSPDTHTHMTFLEGLMGADGLHLCGYRGGQEASIFNQANVLWDVLPTCKIDN